MLWSYFDTVGLTEVQNQASRIGEDFLKLAPPTGEHAALVEQLAGLIDDSGPFDLLAARWLTKLSRDLKDMDPFLFEERTFQGLNGHRWWLRERHSAFVDLGSPTWARHQSHHLAALGITR